MDIRKLLGTRPSQVVPSCPGTWSHLHTGGGQRFESVTAYQSSTYSRRSRQAKTERRFLSQKYYKCSRKCSPGPVRVSFGPVASSADEIGARKVVNVLSTNADLLASANPGCTLQIQKILRESCKKLRAAHPIEILDASISGTRV